MDETLAQVKLHARMHDPADKALVLLRDPAGHEGGTTRTLQSILFPNGLPGSLRKLVRKADHWASAADRPQFPKRESDGRYAPWTQVRFAEHPVLIHPLSGKTLDLRKQGGLANTDIAEIKSQSVRHFTRLIHDDADGEVDWARTLLAYWRFGPALRDEDDAIGLGELWRRLPADTRVPDHTIWDHLDLVSAFSGAFQADANGRCALLNVSLGPVQEFIAAARTTSDLWAGSHLLSRLSWEAMRVVCERLGPDAVLFPNLRGVPQVDLWLREQGVNDDLFQNELWHQRRRSDANPLFSAALPNRFLALVPADQAEQLGKAIETHVRQWLRQKAGEALHLLLETAGSEAGDDCHAYRQLDEQLQGFPEIYWSVVGYDELLETDRSDRDTEFNPERLAEAMRPFLGGESATGPGFLGSDAWSVLQKAIEITDPDNGEAAVFFRPNPGVLYPALFDLSERLMGSTKSLRPFPALTQNGYRCSLTGESEWLTDKPDHLALPPGKREAANTLWTRVARQQPSWARKGEHLGALAALKRLWPTLFCRELESQLDLDDSPRRFVVSTHTMALATSLRTLVSEPQPFSGLPEDVRAAIGGASPVALPRGLALDLRDHPERDLIRRLPNWLDGEEGGDDQDDVEAGRERRVGILCKHVLEAKPETYYALLLMDGDSMGKWLSGADEVSMAYRDAFHPALRDALNRHFAGNAAMQSYLGARRAVSPGRHIAISSALNDFSGVVARSVVEDRYAGRVLYAGGDDLMAMLPTSDLLGAMRELRDAYSGHAAAGGDDTGVRSLGSGFVRHRDQLYLCMGEQATASAGAVIVHHQTPLSAALAELRAAEQRAKREGGRNAFSLSVMKRSGGALRVTESWANAEGCGVDAMTAITELSQKLRKDPGASRRAAYNVAGWLPDLPEPDQLGGADGARDYIAGLLHHQFRRQGLEDKGQPIHSRRFADLAVVPNAAADARPKSAREIGDRLESLLGVAEFFGRETRG